MKIGDFKVTRGEKISGSLKVAAKSLSSIDIPITVISGEQDGPHLCVMAGEHPNEYAGIEAAIRLSKDISPKEISGTITILPIINVPGFEERTPYFNPIDKVNVDEAWPGKLTGGSITEIMLYNIFHKVISKSNCIVSLHGGDICESMIPCAYFWIIGKDDVDRLAEEVAKLFSTEYTIQYSFPAKLVSEAGKLGIPKIIVEAGGEGKLLEKDVEILYKGVFNVMKHLKMIKGEPTLEVKPKIIKGKDKLAYVSSSQGGLFYSNVEVGDIVSKGDIIGEIKDIQGRVLEKIVAPINGKIFFKINPLPWNPSLGWFLFQLVDTGESPKS